MVELCLNKVVTRRCRQPLLTSAGSLLDSVKNRFDLYLINFCLSSLV